MSGGPLTTAAPDSSTVMTEHSPMTNSMLCSTITVLESGAAVVSGPPDIVRTDKRVLDAYLGADLDELEEDAVLIEEEGR